MNICANCRSPDIYPVKLQIYKKDTDNGFPEHWDEDGTQYPIPGHYCVDCGIFVVLEE